MLLCKRRYHDNGSSVVAGMFIFDKLRAGMFYITNNAICRLRRFDLVKLKECLSFLRPDNLGVTVVSQKFPGTWESKEKWYGTEYTYGQIPADLVVEIKKAV